MGKKKVAIIGVTGSVGQEFVQSLNNHPWFEVTQIAASERSAGKKYLDAIKDANGIIAWDVAGEIPEYIKEMTVKSVDELDVSQLDLIFSIFFLMNFFTDNGVPAGDTFELKSVIRESMLCEGFRPP